MPRVTKVTKCRKSPGMCGNCGCKIKVGEPYLHWAFMVGGRGGPRLIRCWKPKCQPKPQDLTRSEYKRAVYDIQDCKFQGDTTEKLESERDDCVSMIQELLAETQDKLDNMPEGLRDGDTGNLLQERVDALEQAVSELESVDCDLGEEGQDRTAEEVCGELAAAYGLAFIFFLLLVAWMLVKGLGWL